MSLIRRRVRHIVLVGMLMALLTLFGSTAVGAADFGYAGRLGGDFARGFSSPSSSGGSGTVSGTNSFNTSGPFSTGAVGVSGPGGAGTISTFHNGR